MTVSAALAAAAWLAASSPAAAPATGRIEGVVRLTAPGDSAIVEAGRTTRVEFALPVEDGQ